MSIVLVIQMNSSPNEKIEAFHPDEVTREKLIMALSLATQVAMASIENLRSLTRRWKMPPEVLATLQGTEAMLNQLLAGSMATLGPDCFKVIERSVLKSREESHEQGNGTKVNMSIISVETRN